MKSNGRLHTTAISLLIFSFFISSSSFASVEKPNVSQQISTVIIDISPVSFHCRFPKIGLNEGFISSLIAIKKAEELAQEKEDFKIIEKTIFSTLVNSPALGLNGFLQHPIFEENDNLHLSAK